MNKTHTSLTLAAVALTFSALAVSCADSKSALKAPTVYDKELVSRYRALANEGYNALDRGDLETALAKFSAQLDLIPEGKLGPYNMACAYGRTGNVEEGITWLEKTVENGWDAPDDLKQDSDLESLRKGPRFSALVEKSRATRSEKSKLFASGLPEYETAPVTFPDMAALSAWMDERGRLLRLNRSVQHDWQSTLAGLDFRARWLAAVRELKRSDPSFDYRLERVRLVGRLLTIWDCWGELAEAVTKEVDSYLASSPGVEQASEANYYAGQALCRKLCEDETSSEAHATRQRAGAYLARVDEGSKFHGSADAWLMDITLQSAGEEVSEALQADVRDLVRECRDKGDIDAMRIMNVAFHERAVESLWPIALDGPDINGREVSLDQYAGKVLLIDFWATWCGPCRAELPNLTRLYERYHPQGFEVVSVSLDYGSKTSHAALKAWIGEHGMDWRHIYEGAGWGDRLAKQFIVYGIPAAFLVGRDGSLVAMGEELSGENLARNVEKALAGDVH
ncbi:MAG: redoxin domain-containing protein [Candidatus Zixiibacteriota bacterium]